MQIGKIHNFIMIAGGFRPIPAPDRFRISAILPIIAAVGRMAMPSAYRIRSVQSPGTIDRRYRGFTKGVYEKDVLYDHPMSTHPSIRRIS